MQNAKFKDLTRLPQAIRDECRGALTVTRKTLIYSYVCEYRLTGMSFKKHCQATASYTTALPNRRY